MSGREAIGVRAGCAMVVAVLAIAPMAHGVGILQSIDIEVAQGGNTLLSVPNVDLSGLVLDGTTPVHLGVATNGTHVWATVLIDKPLQAQEVDRYFEIRLNGTETNVWGSADASLFASDGDGLIDVRLENMAFTDVDATHLVEAFNPNDYKGWGESVPLFYMENRADGFIDLPGVIEVPWPLSMQVPKAAWFDNGYGFANLPNGLNAGFELTGIVDVSGPNAPGVWPINQNPYEVGLLKPQDNPGFVNEIGIGINMRDVVPEPTAIALLSLTGPVLLMGRRRRR